MNTTDTSIKNSILSNKLKEVNSEIDKLTRIKDKLEYYVNDINLLTKNNDVSVKIVPETYIAYSRTIAACTPDEFYNRYAKLFSLIKENNLQMIGTVKAIHHDDYRSFDYNNADIEVAVEVAPHDVIDGITEIRSEHVVASLLHFGKYNSMVTSYKKLMNYIESNQYEYLGCACENYIVDLVTTKNEDEYVTELLLPIKKR